jgi:hypothetical protein
MTDETETVRRALAKFEERSEGAAAEIQIAIEQLLSIYLEVLEMKGTADHQKDKVLFKSKVAIGHLLHALNGNRLSYRQGERVVEMLTKQARDGNPQFLLCFNSQQLEELMLEVEKLSDLK